MTRKAMHDLVALSLGYIFLDQIRNSKIANGYNHKGDHLKRDVIICNPAN